MLHQHGGHGICTYIINVTAANVIHRGYRRQIHRHDDVDNGNERLKNIKKCASNKIKDLWRIIYCGVT